MKGASSALLPGSIRVGPRHRQELGDLKGLAASILERGLIQPIVVTPDGTLAAGARRLAAWGLARGADDAIPVRVLDIDPIAAEHDENLHRLPLAPSEMVSVMRALVPAVQAEARERQRALGRTRGAARAADPSGNSFRKGETRELVASFLGVSHVTLARAAQVVDAAAEDPERFGRLQEAMDRTGNVAGPFKRLVVMRQAAQIRAEPPPLPDRGPYRVIAADPPWPFDPDREDPLAAPGLPGSAQCLERGTHPYPQMSYAAIESFLGRAVGAIAHADAAVWLWTTNHHMPWAYAILAALGLQPKTVLTWAKDKIGRGQYLREQTEHAILAVRGRPAFSLSAESTLLTAPRRGHSEKPAAFYDLVERVCPAPRYACLFSHLQAPRERWDQHSTAAAPDADSDEPAGAVA